MSRSLSCLVLAAPILPLFAAVGDDVEIKPVLNFQVRAEHSAATDATGNAYNVAGGVAGNSDQLDLYVRRFRAGMAMTYQKDWKILAVLNLDNTDRDGSSAANRSNKVQIHQASVTRDMVAGTVTHTLVAGLDYPFFNRAQSANSTALFLSNRASDAIFAFRGTGAGYRMVCGPLRWGADVQNNLGDDSAPTGEDHEGLAWTTRIELTGTGSWAVKKWQESFAGQSGTGFVIGVEAGLNEGDRQGSTGAPPSANTRSVNLAVLGSDMLFHWNGLSALAEVRLGWQETDNDATADTSTRQLIWLVQAGYARSCGSVVLEPALRFSCIDLDRANDAETGPFGTKDYGASGDQIEIALNCYLNGHANKCQVAYTHWQGEDDDAQADIVRLQYQFNY